MRIAIDGTPLLGARTGVATMVESLVGRFAARDDTHVVAYAVSGRMSLDGGVPNGVDTARSRLPAKLAWWFWERADRPRIEHWTGAVDVVHGTNYVGPPAASPVVVTVHDLTFLRFPEMCTTDTLRFPRLLRRAFQRGAHVHTPSDFVRDEVIAEFAIDPARVVRIHHGLAPSAAGDASRGRARAGASRYVLAVGTVEPRKNLPVLVRAFDAVAGDDEDLVLVVAGPSGWGAEALAEATRVARASDRIRRIGYVSPAERADLLAGATLFAYPSLYEGFGFPPLEAMAAGVPVVAGAAGALPEVVGDAALFVDPHDADAVAAGLARLTDDETCRADLIARGRARAATYSWDIAVDEMLKLYRSLS
ncbi:MAG: glycosyltransferase family 4 protein [Actinobacteria bacterium]|nr:glycosyltransferase family 4 protein [Actinomycetota bacterium]